MNNYSSEEQQQQQTNPNGQQLQQHDQIQPSTMELNNLDCVIPLGTSINWANINNAINNNNNNTSFNINENININNNNNNICNNKINNNRAVAPNIESVIPANIFYDRNLIQKARESSNTELTNIIAAAGYKNTDSVFEITPHYLFRFCNNINSPNNVAVTVKDDFERFHELSPVYKSIFRLIADQTSYDDHEKILRVFRVTVNLLAHIPTQVLEPLRYVFAKYQSLVSLKNDFTNNSFNFNIIPEFLDKSSTYEILEKILVLTEESFFMFNLFQLDLHVIQEIKQSLSMCYLEQKYFNNINFINNNNTTTTTTTTTTTNYDLTTSPNYYSQQTSPVYCSTSSPTENYNLAPIDYSSPTTSSSPPSNFNNNEFSSSSTTTPPSNISICQEPMSADDFPVHLPDHLSYLLSWNNSYRKNNQQDKKGKVSKTPSKTGFGLTSTKAQLLKRTFKDSIYQPSNNKGPSFLEDGNLVLINTIYQPFVSEISTNRVAKPFPIMIVKNYANYKDINFKLKVINKDAFKIKKFSFFHEGFGVYRFEISIERIDATQKSCQFIFKAFDKTQKIGKIISPVVQYRNTPSDFDNPSRVSIQRDLDIKDKYHVTANFFKKGRDDGKPLYIKFQNTVNNQEIIISQSEITFESVFWITFTKQIPVGSYDITIAYLHGKIATPQIYDFLI